MKEVVEKIDLKYLITETDSPYLTPHPYRGKENGPKYIPLIFDEICSIKNMAKEDVEKSLEILKANGEDAYIIGEIIKSDEGVILC